jgi:hypothetical protein
MEDLDSPLTSKAAGKWTIPLGLLEWSFQKLPQQFHKTPFVGSDRDHTDDTCQLDRSKILIIK